MQTSFCLGGVPWPFSECFCSSLPPTLKACCCISYMVIIPLYFVLCFFFFSWTFRKPCYIVSSLRQESWLILLSIPSSWCRAWNTTGTQSMLVEWRNKTDEGRALAKTTYPGGSQCAEGTNEMKRWLYREFKFWKSQIYTLQNFSCFLINSVWFNPMSCIKHP